MIELSELVQQLRRELYRSIVAAKDDPLRLELGPIELEVAFTATRDTTAGGKLRIWVVEAGGEVKSSTDSLQRIKLTLTPRFAGSSVTPWIEDEAAPDEI